MSTKLDPKLTLARLRKQRERSVEIDEGGRKKVFFRLPDVEGQNSMLEQVGEQKFMWKVEAGHVCKYVTGWEGITEADLLGETVGSSDLVGFDQELWSEYVMYESALLGKIASALLKAVVDEINKREDARKNSSPGSTPGQG